VPTNLFAVGIANSGGGNDGGLITFDVSGSIPNPVGRLLYSNEKGFAVQVSGTTAFVGLTDSLKVIDVSDMSNPSEIASMSLRTNALAVSGTTLFDGTGDSRVVVLDVSNPASPTQIGSVSIPGPAITIRKAGNLLFVADGANGLLIVDVTQAASPKLLSQFSLSAPIWDVAPSGTVALLAADALGIVVLDVSNPAQVKQLSQTDLPPYNPFPSMGGGGAVTLAASIAIQSGLAYVGTTSNDPDASGAIAVFDFSYPASPRLVGVRDQNAFTISVVTPSGSNLFLAEDGIVAQFDNSFPRNSIELFEPPSPLSQFAQGKARRPAWKAGPYSKLDRSAIVKAPRRRAVVKQLLRPCPSSWSLLCR